MPEKARPEKVKLLQNKRKAGAKSKEKTKEFLTWAKSEGIELWVGDQRLLTLNVDNLIKRKVSFSVIEKRNITSFPISFTGNILPVKWSL